MSNKPQSLESKTRKERISEIENKIKCSPSKITTTNCVSGCVTVFGVGFFLSGWILYSKGYIDEASDLGDYLGGAAGSIFSLAGLMFVYLAFLGQKEQLLYQQQEILYTQEELELNRNVFQSQQEDNKFFQLLNLLRNYVANAKIQMHIDAIPVHVETPNLSKDDRKGKDVDYSGIKCFLHLQQEMATTIKSATFGLDKKLIQDAFKEFYHKDSHIIILSSYFKTMYNTVKFIHENEFLDKKFCFSILKSSLSDQEVSLLFYNGLCYGERKFKPLIEQYALLENLTDDLLVDSSHRDFYKNSAFE